MNCSKKLLLALSVLVLFFASCSKKEDSKSTEAKKLSVVVTTFPQYDWVREIAGSALEDMDLTLLINNGVDLHSYQPSIQDIAKINQSDLFIYVGGESDAWVEDSLVENVRALSLLETLGDKAKEEEVVEGMQEEEHEHEEEEVEYDEHVWLSLRNAQLLCSAITDLLCQADSKNAALYTANCASYNEKLSQLDSQYKSMVEGAKRKTVLFGDRFPFRYLCDDYDITYYAAFVGCSAETEASFQTLAFLAQKLTELDLPCVFQIERGNSKLANAIIQNSGNKKASVCELNSLQSVTSRDIAAGSTYLGIMEQNLEILKKALN
ncbi:MAG: zinc ABC transporter substrate-binding protein [Treponema sp.]|nr:zinc ABC transporter substrate-binding protein [Treponema sp.]